MWPLRLLLANDRNSDLLNSESLKESRLEVCSCSNQAQQDFSMLQNFEERLLLFYYQQYQKPTWICTFHQFLLNNTRDQVVAEVSNQTIQILHFSKRPSANGLTSWFPSAKKTYTVSLPNVSAEIGKDGTVAVKLFPPKLWWITKSPIDTK